MGSEVKSIEDSINRAIMLSVIFLAVAAPCILYIKGTVALVFIVLYCLGLFISAISLISQLINPKGVGMQIGLYTDQAGWRKVSMERYEEFINIYEKRFSTPMFWVSCIIILVWMAVFLCVGMEILVYIAIGLTFTGEIGKYKVYKAIKDNKTVWGAATYMNKI